MVSIQTTIQTGRDYGQASGYPDHVGSYRYVAITVGASKPKAGASINRNQAFLFGGQHPAAVIPPRPPSIWSSPPSSRQRAAGTGADRLPRHFTYWREPAVRSALHRAGWPDASICRVASRDNWLYVLARTST
jgi:hypothetical protein